MRMRGELKTPEGLYYYPNFLSLKEEDTLLHFIESLTYQKVRIHGQDAKRTVVHYGYTYDYQAVSLVPGVPFPKLITDLSEKCAILAEIPTDSIVQCLISNYPAGSTIGWHRDKFIFGPKVIGISLQSSCSMRFQRTENAKRYVFEQILEPRSAYILSGQARYKWEHSIPAVPAKRYSITFRTLK